MRLLYEGIHQNVFANNQAYHPDCLLVEVCHLARCTWYPLVNWASNIPRGLPTVGTTFCT